MVSIATTRLQRVKEPTDAVRYKLQPLPHFSPTSEPYPFPTAPLNVCIPPSPIHCRAGPKIARAAIWKITCNRKKRRHVIVGREIKGKLYSLQAMNKLLLSVQEILGRDREKQWDVVRREIREQEEGAKVFGNWGYLTMTIMIMTTIINPFLFSVPECY